MEAAHDFMSGGVFVDAKAKVASVTKILWWYGSSISLILFISPFKSASMLWMSGRYPIWHDFVEADAMILMNEPDLARAIM